jgi:predicted nicotinamide N-methyase
MFEDTRSVKEIADEIAAVGQSLFYHPVRVNGQGEIVQGQKVVDACSMLGLPSVAAELVLS